MRVTKRRGPKPAVLRVTIDPAEAIRRLVNAKPLRKPVKAGSRSRSRKRKHGEEEAA